MYNTDIPSRAELPTTKQLLRSTIIALIVALVILLTVVLPSEYAVDPTGVGQWLGLTEMGKIKKQLAAEAEADALYLAEQTYEKSMDVELVSAEQPVVPEQSFVAETLIWRDTVDILLTPGQGTEVKLVMAEGTTARFSWNGVQGPLNYDTHGDGGGRSISYEKGRNVRSAEGELTAAFTGNHGWFFRNRTSVNITLILRTAGDYDEIKRVL